MGRPKKLPSLDALERQNPLGLRRGDLRKRLFDGVPYNLSTIAPTKKIARDQAHYYRGKGVLVRVVKLVKGYGLYTR